MLDSIETQRLTLRRWTHEDAPAVDDIYGDAETMRLFADGRTYSPKELAASFVGVLKEYADTGVGNYAVVERSSGHIIGHCGIHLSKEPNVEAEADWLIARDRWNRGYATEAASAVISAAFELHRFGNVGGVAHRDNAASIAVMRKLEMTPVAELMRFNVPSVLYAVSRDVFRGR